MKKALIPRKLAFYLIAVFLLIPYISNAQVIQVEIKGGAVITQGETITINAGNELDFRITNIETNNCKKLKIQDIDISNTVDFDINPNNPKKNIKPEDCRGGKKYLDFEIENNSNDCTTTASTLVTIEIKGQPDFTFTLEVNSSPEMHVLGGSPLADIMHGDTVTSAANGTYYGIVEEGVSESRNYIISNTGGCDLEITSITSSLGDFVVTPYVVLPDETIDFLATSISPGSYIVFIVTFTGPVAGSGTLTSTISIANNDNTTFTFDVSAEMFNFNIPGPGGVTADFRLWLKTTRGITEWGGKVSEWADLGSNGKDAEQPTAANQPTYLDVAGSNINFNPVIEFENNGSTIEEYLYNTSNGFYSQDVFIVMIPDATMTSASTRETIFAGIDSGGAGDITGIGFGNYSTEFTNETLSYNQDIDGGGSFNGQAELNSSYSGAGLINVRNNLAVSPTAQDILYNSVALTTSNVSDVAFTNVGTAGPPVLGTEYWVGRNFDIQGSLNGRIAEIFTFAERVTDADRQKIESYLAIKYGLTLGASAEAEKDYVNSFGTSIWDISANTGYNYYVAGIGKDSISDLNQKQSKTVNITYDVAIGLGGIFDTNNANVNEFAEDGDFLVWGNNNAAYTASGSNTVTISSGVTTSVTRILRKWKIVESKEDVNGDVENVYVSIPSAAFAGFALGADEEYALIVADSGNFANGDIIDVIPLKSDGGSNLQTWYDFDDTKYFTFGKVSKLSDVSSVSIGTGDYLVGESALNLNIDAFTISAWVKSASSANTRTIMAKGSKLQLRLNASDQVEVMVDNDVTPRFTSSMVLNDGKWHQITFVYKSGTIFLYVDGVLDKSEQDVDPPSPNYNQFSVGAVFIDKDNIINPFLGEIDEVYVWDQELTQYQVRYLMNQEIEKYDNGGTDYVTGKELPQASASNEVDTIPWSKLKAYYDFNSFYGSTVEGLTDDRNFLRLKYLNKDKVLTDNQTIPSPYVSASNGTWDSPFTWSYNADQVVPNSLSLDGVTYIDWNIVEIHHDVTTGDRDIKLLGFKNNSSTFTVADPNDAQDETNSGQGLTVTHYLELDGVIDLVGESQLVQSEGSIIDADSGGYIERDQQGTSNGFNYNYWSSSVGPIGGNTVTRGTGISSANANHTISGVLNDGTISSAYTGLNFNSSHTAADSNTPTTPRTISTYWMYKFYGADDNYYAWSEIDEASSLLPGEGFTMKGTSGATNILSDFQNYVYKGLPNNGDITLELNKTSPGDGDVNRLVGNPYPSAIDATEFILDNLSIADGGNNATGTIINGALYFWDHFGEEDSHFLNEYVGGYATRNLTGGVAAISNDVRVNSTSNGGGPENGTKIPGQYIAVNQGFFVSTAIEGHDNDNEVPIAFVDGGDVVFKNSQRVFVPEQIGTSIFLRTSNKKATNRNRDENTNPTIRLKYSSPEGYYRQLMLGADLYATEGFDFGYDAFIVDVNKEDMYWMLDEGKFVIQGVGSFNASQEFPLGIITNSDGPISISLTSIENIEGVMNLYIKDKVTGLTTKINDNTFNVNLSAGEYHERFALVFQSQSELLGESEPEKENDILVYYDDESTSLKIHIKDAIQILKIEMYNLIGQQTKSLKYLPSENSIPIVLSSGVYIVQLKTNRGVVNKKIIIK